MKRIYSFLLAAILGLSAYAQTGPERIVVFDKAGSGKSYLVDYVDRVEFPSIAGEVKADIKFLEFTDDEAVFSVTRTQACSYFRFTVLPAVQINQVTDMALALGMEQVDDRTYSQDFTSGGVLLSELEPNTDYVGVTVGYDLYGTACGVSRAAFTTPEAKLVGDPKVAAEVTDLQQRSFSVTFTPNADVAGYATLAGKKGAIQQQYEQFAPMFGYANFGEMVKGWGYQHTTEPATDNWTDMAPGTDYQVFVQPWDKNGTLAPCDTINLTTKILGGEGVASVSIALGEYKLADWDGEQKYSQFITFTPNDQSSCYRFGVYLAEEYDANPEGIESYTKQDPPMEIVGWYQYETIETDFQINPGVEAVAVAAAKNAKGEWGPLEVVRFTTPTVDEETVDPTPEETEPAPAAAPKAVKVRTQHNFVHPVRQGQLPAIKKQSPLQLTGK